MDIITAYATKNDCYKAATPMTPMGIVVHSTGANNPNLKRYVDCPDECGVNPYGNHWNNPASVIGAQVCVHSFIGYDKDKKIRVANILPYTFASWGVGRGKNGSYNYNPTGHIQFEICEDNLGSKEYCIETYNVAVEYAASLCTVYKLDPLKHGVIVSHKESHDQGYGSNHADPHHWWGRHGLSMDGFRHDVARAMKLPAPNTDTESLSYQVRVTAPLLYIRKGAGTGYGIVGEIRDKGVYTIVAEKTNINGTKWGKLKSGVGWIAINKNYLKRI